MHKMINNNKITSKVAQGKINLIAILDKLNPSMIRSLRKIKRK